MMHISIFNRKNYRLFLIADASFLKNYWRIFQNILHWLSTSLKDWRIFWANQIDEVFWANLGELLSLFIAKFPSSCHSEERSDEESGSIHVYVYRFFTNAQNDKVLYCFHTPNFSQSRWGLYKQKIKHFISIVKFLYKRFLFWFLFHSFAKSSYSMLYKPS